jgi:maltokinase
MADLTALADRSSYPVLASALQQWVPEQRWFAGKARTVTAVSVADTALLSDGESELLEVLADLTFADGHTERYQVPLCEPGPDTDERWVLPDVGLADATAVPRAARALALAALSEDGHHTRAGGTVHGHTVAAIRDLGDPRRMTAEQSNTSVVFGDRHILKVFRRLEPGLNPDVEITAALTGTEFPHVPRQRGALLLDGPDGDQTALGVLTDFVAGSREGWDLAVADVAHVVANPDVAPTSSELLDALGALGWATASSHAALRDAFGADAPAPGQLARWAAGMREQLDRVLATARQNAPEATAPVLERRRAILERIDALEHAPWHSPLIRIHGDYHLGQVLRAPDGQWKLLDFEGEPSRSLTERRRPNAALRDVAGMLRSFDYAAVQGAGSGAAVLPAPASVWRDEARRRFLDAYRSVALPEGILPSDDTWGAHLAVFELDKAVYELGYELGNRPAWVPIPVGGILRVLDGTQRVVGQQGP